MEDLGIAYGISFKYTGPLLAIVTAESRDLEPAVRMTLRPPAAEYFVSRKFGLALGVRVRRIIAYWCLCASPFFENSHV